jgi:hypothetical protein
MYKEIERNEAVRNRVNGFVGAYETAEMHRCKRLPNPQNTVNKIIRSFDEKRIASDEDILRKFKSLTMRMSGNIVGGE